MFSLSFSLCFRTSVFFILFICSISMNFSSLLKVWFQLLKCWNALIELGFFVSFLWLLFNRMWKGVSPTFWNALFCRVDTLTSKWQSYFYKKLCDMYQKFSFVWVLSNVVVVIICWHERHCDLWSAFSFSCILLNFRNSWLCLIIFLYIICLNELFWRKAMTGVALNTFPNVLFILNICQCLLIISLINFGKDGREWSKHQKSKIF